MLYTCCHVGKVSWVELSLFEDYVLRLESEFVCPSPVQVSDGSQLCRLRQGGCDWCSPWILGEAIFRVPSSGAIWIIGFNCWSRQAVHVAMSLPLIVLTMTRLAFPGKGHLLRPFSIAYVKGYKRCLVLLTILQGVRELNLEDVVPQRIRAPCQSWAPDRYGSKIIA